MHASQLLASALRQQPPVAALQTLQSLAFVHFSGLLQSDTLYAAWIDGKSTRRSRSTGSCVLFPFLPLLAVARLRLQLGLFGHRLPQACNISANAKLAGS